MVQGSTGKITPTPELAWPEELTEYDPVILEAGALHSTVLAAGMHTLVEEEIRGQGENRDKQAGRVRVKEAHVHPGPKCLANCEGGIKVPSRTRGITAPWCEGTRELLRGE